MELSQLRYFQMVARLENMSRAAELLYVSQPSLSVSIAKLEEELGVKLFDRSGGRVHLNDDGRQFLDNIEKSLAYLDRGVFLAETIRKSGVEELRLLTMTTGTHLLEAFLESEPEIHMRHQQRDLVGIVDGLVKEDWDCAVSNLPPISDQVEHEVICECDFVAVVAENNPLADCHALTYEQLASQDFGFDNTRTDMFMTLNDLRRSGVSVHVAFDVQLLDVLLGLVAAGRCVTILPRIAVQEAFLNDEIEGVVMREIAATAPRSFLHFVRRKRNGSLPAEERFAEFAKRYYRDIAASC